MPDISKIKLPSGTIYDIKDQGARDLINELNNYSAFLGVTTTALVDGDTTASVVISGSTVKAAKGNIVTYGAKEFIFNGSAWQEFGDLSALKGLAYKDSASGSVTAEGSVSQPTFIGSPVAYTPEGSVSIDSITPAGTVSAPTVNVTPTTTTVNSIGSVGTLPTLTTSVADEVLTISFDGGSLPTKGTDVTVVTGVSATATAPKFTGEEAAISGTFSGSSKSITATGTVSKPNFTGSSVEVSVS